MLPIKAWRIYYADGSTFTSKDGTWSQAPPFGVQCVVYYHVDDLKTLHVEGNDEAIYYYRGKGSQRDYKMGLWMDTEGYYRIMDLAFRSVRP
jgi:hypothetical protein